MTGAPAAVLDPTEPAPSLDLSSTRREILYDILKLSLVGVAIFVIVVTLRLQGSAGSFLGERHQSLLQAVAVAGIIMSFAMAAFAIRRWRDLEQEFEGRIAAERRALDLANRDPLTSLHNRRALSEELGRTLARAKREGLSTTVMLLDLDRFKPINDVHGHVAGDHVLQEAAERLRRIVRVEEFIARIGGDEFAVVITHPRGSTDVPRLVAARIIEAMGAPYRVGAADVHIGTSIGVAVYPSDADDPETLIRRADVALYRAKDAGRGRFSFFEPGMDHESIERAEIEADLRRAIANKEIEPHFQPLIDLATGEIAGFEALARWTHPRKGNVTPAKFIPIAEECGLIGDLSLSIMRQACLAALAWPGRLMLSVNISPIQFRDPWLAEKIMAVLFETKFPARQLEVEITESALMKDIDAASAIIVSLRNQGVSISLDDFGAGYSSFHHLSKLPIDKIKIDGSFVRSFDAGEDGGKIVKAIVKLAASLGLATTGEGVEKVQHAGLLREIGCSYGQGWYFGRPMPAADIVRLFADRDAEQLAVAS